MHMVGRTGMHQLSMVKRRVRCWVHCDVCDHNAGIVDYSDTVVVLDQTRVSSLQGIKGKCVWVSWAQLVRTKSAQEARKGGPYGKGCIQLNIQLPMAGTVCRLDALQTMPGDLL